MVAGVVVALLIPLAGQATAQPIHTVSGGQTIVAYPDNGLPHFCLLNSTTWCADLKNDSFTANETVYLWNDNCCGANGLGWTEGSSGITYPFVCDGETGYPCFGKYKPFSVHSLDHKYDGDPYERINKSKDGLPSSWCLTIPVPTNGGAKLEDCSSTGVLWVEENTSNGQGTGRFINVYASDTFANSQLMSTSGRSNGAAIFVDTANSSEWQKWFLKVN
jgi:hypothetical protein